MLAADALGLVEAGEQVLYDTADRLDAAGRGLPALARSPSSTRPRSSPSTLADSDPVVLGDGPLNGVAAVRAASMLARTARMPATYGELPDAASQIVATFDGPFTAGGGRGAGEREPRRTSSPTRSWTARPSPGSAC